MERAKIPGSPLMGWGVGKGRIKGMQTASRSKEPGTQPRGKWLEELELEP